MKKKEKDSLCKIEEKINIEGITIKSLLPFVILCEKWKEKDLGFILDNFNALSGDDSWNLLDEFEKQDMYDYLVSRGYDSDKRWSDFKLHMLGSKEE